MRKLLALIVLSLVLLVIPAASYAHLNDGFAVCDGLDDIVIVVFDGVNLTGASDDWCFSNPVKDHDSGDNNFNTDIIGVDDVGDHFLMNGFVSSMSLYNDTPWNLRVGLYPDPQYGGIPYCITMSALEHRHFNVSFVYNNTIDSLFVWTNESCG